MVPATREVHKATPEMRTPPLISQSLNLKGRIMHPTSFVRDVFPGITKLLSCPKVS